MPAYREIFYKNYYSSQLGRDAANDRHKFNTEKQNFRREILHLIDGPKNQRILDLGCGTGSLVQALKEAGYTNVTGVDVSEEMVNVAHQLGVPEVIHADVNAFLSSQPGQFDVITGMDIIEHFTKDELVHLLALIRMALTANGRVIFRTPNLDSPMATVYANGDFTHENYLNASSASQVLLNCGFKNPHVLSSNMQLANPLKEGLRRIAWFCLKLNLKFMLFATGRSTRGVVFTPNMLMVAEK